MLHTVDACEVVLFLCNSSDNKTDAFMETFSDVDVKSNQLLVTKTLRQRRSTTTPVDIVDIAPRAKPT